MGNLNSKHPLVTEILEWLFLLGRRGKNIDFCWVPAHCGVQGNERADILAKQMSVNVPRRMAVPVRDTFPDINKKIKEAWQLSWESLVGCNQKMWEITTSTLPWVYGSMPRRWETALCRLRIGHTRLTHGFLMAGQPQPFCDDCLVPLTVRHLLVECPSLGDFRRRFLSDCRDREGNYLLSKVIGEDVVFNKSGVFKFVEATSVLKEL